MIMCDKCKNWIHSVCEDITDENEYLAITNGTHLLFAKEYLCNNCRCNKFKQVYYKLIEHDRLGIFSDPVFL